MSSGSDGSGAGAATACATTDLAFDALADPVRREILAVLAGQDECTAGALAERITRVGRTAVSMHLRVLRVAGLVAERREGRFRHYSLNPTGPADEVMTLLQELFRRQRDGRAAGAGAAR